MLKYQYNKTNIKMSKKTDKEIKEIKRLLNSEEFLRYEVSEDFFNNAYGFLESNKLMMVDYFVMKEQDALKEMENRYFRNMEMGINEMDMIEESNKKSVNHTKAKIIKLKR